MSKFRFLILIAVALIMGILPMQIQARSAGSDFRTLRTLYATALVKRGDAISQAMAAAESILATAPRDPLATAYKGSLLTLMAAESWLPWTKLRYVNAGIDMMDDAVAATRDQRNDPSVEAEVLVVCGLTNAALPSMFRREPNARKEITSAIANPAFADIDVINQARALAIAAAYARKDGDAKRSDDLLTQAKARDVAEAQNAYHGHI